MGYAIHYPSASAATPGGRLGLTLALAMVVHALLILGVGFDWMSPEASPAPPTLDVVLTPPSDAPAPEQADYLGVGNREGDGNTSEPTPPEQPRADPAALQSASTPVPPLEPAPTQLPAAPRQSVTAVASPKRSPAEKTPATHQRRELPTAAQLMDLSMEMARLEEGIHETRKAYSSRPRTKFISASTREHLYAAYMAAWVAKVERVGNLNYPDEARRKNLSGALVLDVVLNPDGTINHIELVRSSGERVLDDAAIRIVRLAAPFARFPDKMRRDIDVLHITKTWQFLNDNRWSGG